MKNERSPVVFTLPQFNVEKNIQKPKWDRWQYMYPIHAHLESVDRVYYKPEDGADN